MPHGQFLCLTAKEKPHGQVVCLTAKMSHTAMDVIGFEDCRTGPPREPRAGRTDASWLERVDAEVASCPCWIGLERSRAEAGRIWSGTRAVCLLSGSVRRIVSASRERAEAERLIGIGRYASVG
ncbi:hypothetical protein F2Q69_00027902 [Brassica cretica]|uniref:Uncharacterized protein n=1 Tax=Brassica cretica TaxID=69181 RepID=A0A8S9S3D6_BRACR|nr:hypothetical protein F2Q69_00027902 [Brassica cretica]